MGEVFAGRYELVDPIGRGGVGAVWRTWDHRRRRYVAAKVLQHSDAHALLRFVREQATRIDHPHVLAPASWAADDDKVLFTMDLVRGGSLSHLVGGYGPLTPAYVCVLLDQLLAGLAAVHAEGIIHRDIKPANILLEATGTGTPHVRLSDFGIAMHKGEARLTESNYVVGTPGYFAPEQLLGADPDVPADLYAVGLVALYLLGGQKPDAAAISARFLAMGMPPAPLGVPDPLWQVVGALLQPDPAARFRTATGARKALHAAMELMPDGSAAEPPVEIPDLVGPLPEGFGPDGPAPLASPWAPPPWPPSAFRPGPRPPRAAVSTGWAEAAGRQAGPGGFRPPAREPAAEPDEPAQGEPVPPPGAAPPGSPLPPGSPPPGAAPQAPFAGPPDPEAGPPRPEAPRRRPAGPGSTAGGPGATTHTRTRAEPPAPVRPVPLPPPAAATADTASAGLPARRPRPGPPAGVVVPVLVLAAICFAVGFLALAAAGRH